MASGRIDPLLLAASHRVQEGSAAIRASVEHHGEAGRGREQLLARELVKLLPRRFTVETGSVLGAGHLTSGQVDILVCDRDDFPVFDYGAETGVLLLPPSVYAAISVKTRLRPADLGTHFAEARELKRLISEALGATWSGLYCVFASQLDGEVSRLYDAYHGELFNSVETGVDLIAALNGNGLCANLQRYAEAVPPTFVAGRSHVLGIQMKACGVDTSDAFTDFYKLLLLGLERITLNPSMRGVVDLPTNVEVPALRRVGFDAVFAGKSADIVATPGMSAYFTMFYANTGQQTWAKGTTTEVFLVAAGPRDYRPPAGWATTWISGDVYCTHTQQNVRPGEIGTFTFGVAIPRDAAVGICRLHARLWSREGDFVGTTSYANVVTVVTPEQFREMFPPQAESASDGTQ